MTDFHRNSRRTAPKLEATTLTGAIKLLLTVPFFQADVFVNNTTDSGSGLVVTSRDSFYNTNKNNITINSSGLKKHL